MTLNILRILSYFLAFSIYGLSYWAKRQFDVVSLDEVLSTLMFSRSGLFVFDKQFIQARLNTPCCCHACLLL